jgi:hypothetical protein
VGHVGELRHAALHSIRHLVRGDARIDFRVPDLAPPHPVQAVHEIDRFTPRGGGNAFRVRYEQYRVALGSKLDALIYRWQKSAAPAGFAAVGRVLAREQDDEAGQIAAVAAQPVGEP